MAPSPYPRIFLQSSAGLFAFYRVASECNATVPEMLPSSPFCAPTRTMCENIPNRTKGYVCFQVATTRLSVPFTQAAESVAFPPWPAGCMKSGKPCGSWCVGTRHTGRTRGELPLAEGLPGTGGNSDETHQNADLHHADSCVVRSRPLHNRSWKYCHESRQSDYFLSDGRSDRSRCESGARSRDDLL